MNAESVRGARRSSRWRTLGAAAGAVVLAACASSSPGQSGQSGGTPDLQLRPVLSVTPLGSDRCPSAGRDAADSTTPVPACSTDGSLLYSLGAAAVTGGQVSSLSVQDSGATAEIQVSLDDVGTSALTTATTQLASKPAPESQLAVYVHGRVLSAPVVTAPLTSGPLVIAGFTPTQARQVVDGLAAG